MTNFGARAILALPLGRGPGEAAELRLLLTLEATTRVVNAKGDRRISLALAAELAGLPEISARRARDRLVAKNLLAYERGPRGRGSVWRFLFAIPIRDHLSERETSEYALTLDERDLGTDPVRAHSGRARLNDRFAITKPGIRAHPDRSLELSTTDETSLSSTADRARDDDAQPDWRRGPGPREPAPGQTGIRRDGRPTPMPPPWAAPNGRALPTERVAELAADAKRRLAGRPRPADAPPPPPRTDDERRALARRQVREATRRREADRMTEPAEHRPPERDLGDPPTPLPDDEPVIFEPPDSGEGPPDECPF